MPQGTLRAGHAAKAARDVMQKAAREGFTEWDFPVLVAKMAAEE